MIGRFRTKTAFFHFLLDEPIAGTPRHASKKIHADIRRSDCARAISSHILTTNSWCHTETKYYKTNIYANYTWRSLLCFPRAKVQRSTLFLRDRSWLFAHVFYESLPSRWRMCFFPSFFADKIRSCTVGPNIKYINKTYLAEKKNTPTDCQGFIEHAC